MIADQWLAISGGGFVVGLLIGITGVGAGSLTTPMLISGFGVPPLVAVGTDLFFAAITKASAAWYHHRLANVDWRVLRTLATGSVPGAIIIIAILSFVDIETYNITQIIRPALAIALVGSAIAISLRPLIAGRSADFSPSSSARRTIVTILFGVLLGALVAITSVGAGAIGIAALMILYPTLAARRLVGTDVVHAVPLTLAAGFGHLSIGNIDIGILAALLIGSLPGVAIGSRMTGLLPDSYIRIVLTIVLTGAALVLLFG
jgi:uncharacterized protein